MNFTNITFKAEHSQIRGKPPFLLADESLGGKSTLNIDSWLHLSVLVTCNQFWSGLTHKTLQLEQQYCKTCGLVSLVMLCYQIR